MLSKPALRREILVARGELTAAARVAAETALRQRILDCVGALNSVAAYVSIGTEPGTSGLLAALRERGTTVLLPVLRPDNDLDWAVFDGSFAAGPHGLLEPVGDRRGIEAIAAVDAIVVPALAVDRAGHRLGRGGGSYDRALARAADVLTIALLYDNELLDKIPVQPHDRPVDAAATPSALHRFIPRRS